MRTRLTLILLLGFLSLGMTSFTYAQQPKTIIIRGEVILDVRNADVTIINEDPEPGNVEVIATPLTGIVPLTVRFFAAGGETFTWVFGDGEIGSGKTPTHVYQTIGRFIATVTNGDGKLASVVILVDVEEGHDLGADISANPKAGQVPLVVAFDATGSTGENLTYHWTFGDGGVSDQAVVNHTYQEVGSYPVTLTVSDGDGIDIDNDLIVVSNSDPPTNLRSAVSGPYAGLPIDPVTGELHWLPLEFQGWWNDVAANEDFGHQHTAVFMPVGQVSGDVVFHVRNVAHNNPSLVEFSRICRESTCKDVHSGINIALASGLAAEHIENGLIRGRRDTTLVWTDTYVIDTTTYPNGVRELRFTTNLLTESNARWYGSSRAVFDVQNGSGGRSNYQRFCVEDGVSQSAGGTSWYSGFKYATAFMECVPKEPVSGVWKFRVRTHKRSDSLTVMFDQTHNIDASFPKVPDNRAPTWLEQPAHQGFPGQFDNGSFEIVGGSNSFVGCTLDTTTMENGWHTVAIKTQVGPHSAILKCWFYVQN